jgi:hypothetical protein
VSGRDFLPLRPACVHPTDTPTIPPQRSTAVKMSGLTAELLSQGYTEYTTAERRLRASLADLPPVPSTEAMRRLARAEAGR